MANKMNLIQRLQKISDSSEPILTHTNWLKITLKKLATASLERNLEVYFDSVVELSEVTETLANDLMAMSETQEELLSLAKEMLQFIPEDDLSLLGKHEGGE